MKKRLYRKVLKTLRKFFGKGLKGHKRRRMEKLAALICGLMREKSPDMRSLGSGIPRRIKSHSKEKESKKFLENRWIDGETWYSPYIKEVAGQVIGLFPKGSNVTLVMDGSKMGKDHMALMASLHFRGRGLPLAWSVKKMPKGHFPAGMHVDLAKKVHRLLAPAIGPHRTVTLLGDGEFDSTDLQKLCLSIGWDYVFRTARDTVLYENGSRFQPKGLSVDPLQGFFSAPGAEFTEKREVAVHFVLWHGPGHEDPIPLVSNMEEPIDIIEAYAKRYSIECMFRDMKSTTYNVHRTRLRSGYAIANLIMVAAFALVLLVKIGMKYRHSPLREYIHRVRGDQKNYSFITFARDFLRYCLDEGIPFSFSFQFSKFSMNSS